MNKNKRNVILCIIMLLTLTVSGIWYETSVNYEFNNEFRSHIKNANVANTPELMISEFQKAQQGISNLGLNNSDYSSLWWWKETPDHCIEFYIILLDSFIERAEDIIEWRNNVNVTEDFNDVYRQKIINLQDELVTKDETTDIRNDGTFGNVFGSYKVSRGLHVAFFGWIYLIISVIMGVMLGYTFLHIYVKDKW